MKPSFTIPGFDWVPNEPAPKVAPQASQQTVSAPVPTWVSPAAPFPFLSQLLACQLCTARAEAQQVVGGVGPLDARILVVGQNPGAEEDSAGVPFIGSSGDEFNTWLPLLGLDRSKLLITNAVKCHTRMNRAPSAKEIKACGPWLLSEVTGLTSLQAILTLGKPAAISVLGPHAPPMTPIVAHHLKVRDPGGRELRVFPLPHPAYLLRARNQRPMFLETVLDHVKRTMELAVPDAMAWSRKR